VIAGADGDAVPLAVTLPTELVLESGQVAHDGTVVYLGPDGTAAAVQVLDDGATRVQTIIGGADGPTQFTYGFSDGVTPVLGADGSITLVSTVDGAVIGLGEVGRAWAVDADGAAVPTWYEMVGDALVQHVTVEEVHRVSRGR
jgi:hypothetical protein